MRALVTGAAGFIGAALSQLLLDRRDQVVGLDNLNDYYDVGLKEARLALLSDRDNFRVHQAQHCRSCRHGRRVQNGWFERAAHLAAQVHRESWRVFRCQPRRIYEHP